MATKNSKTKTRKSVKAKATKAKTMKVERARLPVGGGGLRRPAGDITGRIWDIADTLKAKSKEIPSRSEVMDACNKAKIGAKDGTMSTQYQRWRVFHNLAATRRRATKVPKPPKAKAAKKAAKKAVPKPPIAKKAVPKPPAQASANA